MNKKTLTATLAAAAALLVSAPLARANAVLTVISGSSSVSVPDLGTGAASTTQVSFAGWNITVDSGIGYDVSGTASLPQMDVSTQDHGSGSAGTLYVIWSQTGYTFIGPVDATISQTVSVSEGAAITYNTYATTGGILVPTDVGGVATGLPATPLTTQVLTSTAGTVTAAFGNDPGDPTLTQELIISGTTLGVSADAHLDGVPDGGLTVALLGGVLVGFAGIRSRFGGKRN
jgi:hypothetical protein